MRCISAYLWELREVHKKIQNESLTKEKQEEIIGVNLRAMLPEEIAIKIAEEA